MYDRRLGEFGTIQSGRENGRVGWSAGTGPAALGCRKVNITEPSARGRPGGWLNASAPVKPSRVFKVKGEG